MCFSFFWKVFCFCKNGQNLSKTVLPYFGDFVAGWSSHMPQSQAHTEIFRNSLASKCLSRKKYLEYFSKIWVLMFLAAQYGDLFAGGRSSRKRYTEIFATYLTTLLRVDFPVAKNTQKNFQIFGFQVSRGLFCRLARDLVQSRKSRVLHIEGYFQGRFQKLFIFPSCIIITVHTFISCPLFSLTPLSIRVKKGESILFLVHIYRGRNSLFLSFYYLLYLEGLMSNVSCACVLGYKYKCSKFITALVIHDKGSDMIGGEKEKEIYVILTMFLLCSQFMFMISYLKCFYLYPCCFYKLLGFVSMCFVGFYGLYHAYAVFMLCCLVLLAKCYGFYFKYSHSCALVGSCSQMHILSVLCIG